LRSPATQSHHAVAAAAAAAAASLAAAGPSLGPQAGNPSRSQQLQTWFNSVKSKLTLWRNTWKLKIDSTREGGVRGEVAFSLPIYTYFRIKSLFSERFPESLGLPRVIPEICDIIVTGSREESHHSQASGVNGFNLGGLARERWEGGRKSAMETSWTTKIPTSTSTSRLKPLLENSD